MYVYVCMYMHVCVCLCLCMYMYVLCMYIYVHVCKCMCACNCVHMCVCVRLYVLYMCASVCQDVLWCRTTRYHTKSEDSCALREERLELETPTTEHVYVSAWRCKVRAMLAPMHQGDACEPNTKNLKGSPTRRPMFQKNASEAGCDGRAWRRQGSETTDPGTAARIEGEGPGRAECAKGGVPATPEAESKRRKIAKAGPAPRAHAKTLSSCMQNVALFIEKPLQSAMSGSAFPSGRGPSRRAGFEVLFVP